MSKDYERINFNIKHELLEEVDKYCSAGYGRSALLNYLVAEALSRESVKAILDGLKAQRQDN